MTRRDHRIVDSDHGSGDGGPLGTPEDDTSAFSPPGHEQAEGMVVSGGGVATPSEQDAVGQGDRGLG